MVWDVCAVRMFFNNVDFNESCPDLREVSSRFNWGGRTIRFSERKLRSKLLSFVRYRPSVQVFLCRCVTMIMMASCDNHKVTWRYLRYNVLIMICTKLYPLFLNAWEWIVWVELWYLVSFETERRIALDVLGHFGVAGFPLPLPSLHWGPQCCYRRQILL